MNHAKRRRPYGDSVAWRFRARNSTRSERRWEPWQALRIWPADTTEPVLELTTGDLLREAAGDAGAQTAIIEAAPPGTPSLTGAERTGRRWTYRELLAEAGQCAQLR